MMETRKKGQKKGGQEQMREGKENNGRWMGGQ